MILNRNKDNFTQVRPLTNQRRLLLGILREANDHIDAKELYHRASATDESVSLATVYRALRLFKELGLVDEMRLGRLRCYYEIKNSPGHQHLVCQECGNVMEFQTPYFQKLIETIQREYGLKVTKAELYLEGYCQKCEEKKDT